MQHLLDKGAVLFNWLYSPRRNLRRFKWALSTWYLKEPAREKIFPQHLFQRQTILLKYDALNVVVLQRDVSCPKTKKQVITGGSQTEALMY